MKPIHVKTTLVWQIPYITDGLAAYWDGEWNAGGNRHNSTATTWKDLVGAHDFILKPSAMRHFTWLDKGLRHIGTNYDIAPDFTMKDIIGARDVFTVSYLVNFERTNDMKRYTPLGFADSCFGFNWNGTNFFAYLPWPHGGITKPFDSLLNTDMMFTVGTDGTHYYAAHDGVHIHQRACSDYRSVLAQGLYVFCSPGQNPTAENSWICTIRRILIYNRPLAEAEDAFNYRVDRWRFGY